jgi:hypothetical protein
VISRERQKYNGTTGEVQRSVLLDLLFFGGFVATP